MRSMIAMRLVHHHNNVNGWTIVGDLVFAVAVIATVLLVIALFLNMMKRPSPINWLWALITALVAWIVLLIVF